MTASVAINKKLPSLIRNAEQYLPVCPQVFSKLNELLGSANSSCEDLARVVALDPILASEVLRIVNSIRFGTSSNVSSIEHAVLRMGFQEVNTIALSLQARGIFKGSGWSEFNVMLWKHSVRTAALAKLLANRHSLHAAPGAFTAGLLHDIGKMVLVQADPEYARVLGAMGMRGRECVSFEIQRYGTDHTVVGAELLRNWRMPAALVKQIEEHHSGESGPGRPVIQQVLVFANELSNAAPWDKLDALDADSLAHLTPLLKRMNLAPELCRELLRMAVHDIALFEVA